VELVSYNPLFCIGFAWTSVLLRSDDGKLVYHCWVLQESDAKEKCQQVAAYCGGVCGEQQVPNVVAGNGSKKQTVL
jgi:hypothetical protein